MYPIARSRTIVDETHHPLNKQIHWTPTFVLFSRPWSFTMNALPYVFAWISYHVPYTSWNFYNWWCHGYCLQCCRTYIYSIIDLWINGSYIKTQSRFPVLPEWSQQVMESKFLWWVSMWTRGVAKPFIEFPTVWSLYLSPFSSKSSELVFNAFDFNVDFSISNSFIQNYFLNIDQLTTKWNLKFRGSFALILTLYNIMENEYYSEWCEQGRI